MKAPNPFRDMRGTTKRGHMAPNPVKGAVPVRSPKAPQAPKLPRPKRPKAPKAPKAPKVPGLPLPGF